MTDIKFPEITAQHRTRSAWMRVVYKVLSARIIELKKKRKMPKGYTPKLIGSHMQNWTGNVEGLDELRSQARVLNIARGLLSGFKLEQIEAKPRLATGSTAERHEYARIVGRAISLITDDFPVYVAVNTAVNMTPEQQAVQAGHALALLLQNARDLPWSSENGVLKYMDGSMLFGPSAASFEARLRQFSVDNPTITCTGFAEPDLDDRLTAVALYAPFGLPWSLRHMPLLKMTPDPVAQHELVGEPPRPGIFARLT